MALLLFGVILVSAVYGALFAYLAARVTDLSAGWMSASAAASIGLLALIVTMLASRSGARIR